MARRNCPKCSTEVSDTALRCAKCGVRLTKPKRNSNNEERMARRNCPKCSTEVSDTALRCAKCGVRLTKPKRNSNNEERMARRNCPKCSTEVSDTALRCAKCGVRLTKPKRNFLGESFKWIIGFMIAIWFIFGTKTIIGFLSMLGGIVFLAMIVGLIKPSILRMTPLSSRLRVFGVGTFSLIVLAFIQDSLEPQPSQADEQSVELGKTESSDSESKSDGEEDDDPNKRWKEQKAEERYRRTEDPTYLNDLKAALKEGRKLIGEAEAALNARN